MMLMVRTLLRRSLLGAVLVFGALPAAGAAENDGVFADPSRVASIGGSLTEIVFALGRQKDLVARDSTSLYPPAALELPDVGYMRQLSPEGVLSVNPSGILALQGSGPREAVDVLKKASVPYIEVPETFDHEGILAKIRAVGKALGADDEAAKLASQVDARLKAAEKLTAAVRQRKRVLFILSMQGGKILASGSGTAADGIIKLAGAVNAVEGYSGYKQLSDEAVITADPDLVLMMEQDDTPVSGSDPFDNPAIAATAAGKSRALVRMQGSYLLSFGPRTAEAIHDLAVSIYGQQVTD